MLLAEVLQIGCYNLSFADLAEKEKPKSATLQTVQEGRKMSRQSGPGRRQGNRAGHRKEVTQYMLTPSTSGAQLCAW